MTDKAKEPKQHSPERDYNFAVRISALAMMTTLLVCSHSYLWAGRIYAPAPLIAGLETVPAIINTLLYVFGLSMLGWLLVKPANRMALGAIICCHIFWVLQDVARMQPFFYMFTYTFLMAALFIDSKKDAVTAMKIMVCGVYFWAGYHKINLIFYMQVFPWFVSPIYDFTDKSIPDVIQVFAGIALILTPFLEAAIGILLLFPSTRKHGSILAYTMLVVVLMCLGPFGHSWAAAVWPWNVWIFLMEYHLICSMANRDQPRILTRNMSKSAVITFLLFFIAPALAFWSTWYTYPGFKLYSGNTMFARVVSPPEETYAKLPDKLRENFIKKHSFDVWEWAKYEPLLRYPTAYAYKKGAEGLCPYLDFPEKATIVMELAPPFYTIKRPEEKMKLCQ